MDGYPRTVVQAETFNGGVDQVVFIDVNDREALWRISGRVSDREDETLGAIRKRIELFKELTTPVLNYYKEQNKLISIDGEQTVEKVFADITDALEK